MRYGLETTDAWIAGIQSIWAKSFVFWGLFFFSSLLGQAIFGQRVAVYEPLQFGGFSFLIIGPLVPIGIISTTWLFLRFFVFDTATARDFFIPIITTGLNAGYYENNYSPLIWIVLNTILAIGFLYILYRAYRVACTS